MLRKLIFAFFFCSTSFCFAQTVAVSEPLTIRNDIAYEIIGQLKNNLLLFRDQTNDFKVQCYDENMRLSWSKEIELDKRRPTVIGMVNTQQDFSIFYKKRWKGETILKMHRYDAAANLIDSAEVFNFGGLLYTPDFEIIHSLDKSKAMIYYFEDLNKVRALVFDMEQLEVMWEISFAPEDLQFYRDFRQIFVDNSGNMHFIVERENRKSKQDEHYLELFEVGPDTGEKLRTSRIPMQGHMTYDVFFQFDEMNNQLLAGGLYSDENRGRTNGYFYLKVPHGNAMAHELHFQEFEDRFISDLLEKNPEKEQKGLIDADIQEIVLRQDGGILIVGEINRLYERRSTQMARVPYNTNDRLGGRFITDFYYDDIFLISIHNTGEEHWKSILHKKQYSQDDGGVFASYFLAKTPRNLRIIFNDEVRNETTVSEYAVSGNGDVDRTTLMNTDNQQLRVRFRDGLQVAADEIIFPSEFKSRLKLVRVTY